MKNELNILKNLIAPMFSGCVKDPFTPALLESIYDKLLAKKFIEAQEILIKKTGISVSVFDFMKITAEFIKTTASAVKRTVVR